MISSTKATFNHVTSGEDAGMSFRVKWSNVSVNAVRIPQSDINKWVEELVVEMITDDSNIVARVCGDTVVVVMREDPEENYFSVEVAKRSSVAYVQMV